MKFSQRMGINPVPEALKPEAMPNELRSSLWNIFLDWRQRKDEDQLLAAIWRDYWKQPIDTLQADPGYGGRTFHGAWNQVRDHFFGVKWFGVYDFLEFVIGLRQLSGHEFGRGVNWVLERELAAYRVIGTQFVPVTSEQEVEALEEALDKDDRFAPVSEHLATALAHLSNRQNPDYRNSIKESISAVEAAARVICNDDKATLGAALGILGKQGKLHSALKSAYSSLYGYTNDADGIRHALLDEPNLTADEAKYFLIACTAFVNYLKTLA
jgi:hypothetical protein